MDISKHKICLFLLMFSLEITLLSCQSTLSGGVFSKLMAEYRRQIDYGKFATRKKNTKFLTRRRTPPVRATFNQSVEEQCKFISKYCHKSHRTGRLCGRTLFYFYYTFTNYCMMDYVNCVERYEMWQVAHMGQCYTPKLISEYHHLEYNNDSFLDRDTVKDDHHWDF